MRAATTFPGEPPNVASRLLARNSGSGAIDYLRSGFLQDWILSIQLTRPLGLPRIPQPLPDPLVPISPPSPRPQLALTGRAHQLLLRGEQRNRHEETTHGRVLPCSFNVSRGVPPGRGRIERGGVQRCHDRPEITEPEAIPPIQRRL